jgi:ribosomal protein L14E/L6E/L27E
MERVPINFKRLSLTDIKIDIKRVPKKKDLIKAMEEAGLFLYPFIYNNCFLAFIYLFISCF